MRMAINTPQSKHLVEMYGYDHTELIKAGVNYIDAKPSSFDLLINYNLVTGISEKKIKVTQTSRPKVGA